MGLSTASALDPVARARLLARIRDAVLSGVPAPQQPRPVVSESWRHNLAERLGTSLPLSDPRHATITARADRLHSFVVLLRSVRADEHRDPFDRSVRTEPGDSVSERCRLTFVGIGGLLHAVPFGVVAWWLFCRTHV